MYAITFFFVAPVPNARWWVLHPTQTVGGGYQLQFRTLGKPTEQNAIPAAAPFFQVSAALTLQHASRILLGNFELPLSAGSRAPGAKYVRSLFSFSGPQPTPSPEEEFITPHASFFICFLEIQYDRSQKAARVGKGGGTFYCLSGFPVSRHAP